MLTRAYGTMGSVDVIPPDLLVSGYPSGIRTQANRLRALVRAAEPGTTERVRPRWRLIGLDLPLDRRTRYFAWVMVEQVHVHLGFEYGAWMRDPEGLLEGAHLRLKKVRFLTFLPGQPIPRAAVLRLVREAALVARLSAPERMLRALDREWAPEGPRNWPPS